MSAPLQPTTGLQVSEKQPPHVLEAIDREIAFYRRRAGQVFFLGLTVEVLILAGREKIVVPAALPWIPPLSYGVLFIAVAALGILLGKEYRDRIHVLKNARDKTLAAQYPPTGGVTLSEIEMLNVVLVFLSSSGLILVWLNALTANEGRSWAFGNLSGTFGPLFWFFIFVGASGIGWVSWNTLRWIFRGWES